MEFNKMMLQVIEYSGECCDFLAFKLNRLEKLALSAIYLKDNGFDDGGILMRKIKEEEEQIYELMALLKRIQRAINKYCDAKANFEEVQRKALTVGLERISREFENAQKQFEEAQRNAIKIGAEFSIKFAEVKIKDELNVVTNKHEEAELRKHLSDLKELKKLLV
ncbi:hypothetical protein NSQ51_13745 [Geobacillus sp. FSL K6-0789]|uniref:Uncharacterized protein n=1 Tax=Geobacillus stearothermophilus TaxID=1422 RepID=A0A3L7D9X1_GEOSE|nr:MULTISPECIES: hypothetical protein [Geobacillus]KDE47035.1 hypothetical protein DI44_15180 [Geobacillus sp. CAMR5420]RLQ05493.1 hypothetical protein D9549_14705 [Geobacillus stearothermophilus]RLQ06269.1 hypothetical protein D9547_14175 [Geobacillus stearothermophilus]RLQ12972.1 hypothetical protein D9548_14490 [Geobacillus stearothermophilus]